MALNCEASSPIQLKFELHWDFMPLLVASKFEEDHSELLCLSSLPESLTSISHQRWLRKVRDIIFFTSQLHVTPKWLVRSGRNLNPSNTSCLSLLPVSLMKIEFKATEKKWRHHFLHYRSMGKNFCKLDKDPIKGDWEKLATSLFSPLKGM